MLTCSLPTGITTINDEGTEGSVPSVPPDKDSFLKIKESFSRNKESLFLNKGSLFKTPGHNGARPLCALGLNNL